MQLFVRERLPQSAALFAAVVGVFVLVGHYGVFLGRAAFPLDLEWMEGGTLIHALRLSQGQGIYVPPSVDFIPFLYTPLYPLVVAALSKVFGIGYLPARVVSIVAFSGALAIVVWLATRQATGATRRSRVAAAALGVAGAGAACAAYVFAGAFYDLVRADSLLLSLEVVALALAYQGRGYRSALLAGVVIALAFFTKQTASILGIGLGVGLLVAHWRRGLVYGTAAALTLIAGCAYFQIRSDGWFWTYIYKLHQSHSFNWQLAFVATPLRLLRATWPTWLSLLIVLVALTLQRRWQRRDVLLVTLAVAGFGAACVGFGTRWAFENAFVPATFFPALAAAVLLARAVQSPAEDPAPTSGSRTWVGAALALAIVSLGYQGMHHERPARDALVPGPGDLAAAGRFLDILTTQPGDGFVPFHPYYPVLAGKAPHVHRMGVMDVAASHGRPAGLDSALAEQRFPFVVLDWKSVPGEWPALDARYHLVHQFQDGVDAVRSFSGAETSPRQLLWPTRSAPLLSGGRRIADFESGIWAGWQTEGTAFGDRPAFTRTFGFGRFVADSGHAGPAATGTLRSLPIKVEGPDAILRFHVAGARDDRLRVFLIAGAETPHQMSPAGRAETIDWPVSLPAGTELTLVVEDLSPEASLAIDEVVLLPGAPTIR